MLFFEVSKKIQKVRIARSKYKQRNAFFENVQCKIVKNQKLSNSKKLANY